jgi:hypothetical protein
MRSTFRSTFSPKPSPFSPLPPLTNHRPFALLPASYRESLISFPRSPSLSTSEFNTDPCVTSRTSPSALTIGWSG